MLKSKLGMNINVMLMMKKLHVDVSQYVTWTSKATWEYGFSYYDYASQIIVWLFDEVSMIERYGTFKELFCCKMIGGSWVNTHVLRMIGYIEKLGQLSFVTDLELNVTFRHLGVQIKITFFLCIL
jgi:hypothetical protein